MALSLRSGLGYLAAHLRPELVALVAGYVIGAPHAREKVVAELKARVMPDRLRPYIEIRCRCSHPFYIEKFVDIGDWDPVGAGGGCGFKEHDRLLAWLRVSPLRWSLTEQSVSQWQLAVRVAGKNRDALSAAWQEARGPPPPGRSA